MKGVESLGDLVTEDRLEKLTVILNGGYLFDEGNHDKSIIEQTSDPHYFPALSVLLDASVFLIKYGTTGHENWPLSIPDESQSISLFDPLTFKT
ncbi:unnamed protein product [Hymenolepis diminuta]|uniref:Fe/B12 periplasmic-binding domain-containing protein n=1 Tax=Hymenolepis diminuta TaxID=6216 RepID=A0A0R3SP96_HYMDI|nr:unnamed protein product [Hymenolepis diminuta]